MTVENVIIMLCIINAGAFLLLIVLTISLDSKLWSKLDRVVNIIILERQEILKKIEGILIRIEQIEKRLK